MDAVLDAPVPVSSHDFEGFLAELEHCVPDSGRLHLFTGDHLRLEIMLLRHEKDPRVIWGLKGHEDWAFKASLLRFARGTPPAHLLLSTGESGDYQLQGWVVQRTLDRFWASRLSAEHARGFSRRCRPPSLDGLDGSRLAPKAG